MIAFMRILILLIITTGVNTILLKCIISVMENKSQIAFELIAKMVKEKSKYLVRIALKHPDREDLKTIFRKLDDGK